MVRKFDDVVLVETGLSICCHSLEYKKILENLESDITSEIYGVFIVLETWHV